MEKIATDFYKEERAIESAIQNLLMLMHHPCAPKYAAKYKLPSSLLLLTIHQSQDVVACAWKVLAANIDGWAAPMEQYIKKNIPGKQTLLTMGPGIRSYLVFKNHALKLVSQFQSVIISYSLQNMVLSGSLSVHGSSLVKFCGSWIHARCHSLFGSE